MEASKKMMANFDAKLAEEVRKHRHLYDPSLDDYKDLVLTSRSWKEIAKTLQTEEHLCRKRWKYIRESFVRLKRKMRARNGGGRKESSYKYSQMLSWMAPHVKHREPESSL